MKKLNFIGFSLIGLSLLSCENDAESTYIDCDRLTLDIKYNHFYETDRSTPYNGECRTFYIGGKIKQIREIQQGKNHGRYEEYSEDGVLIEEGSYYENLHHGVFKYYNDEGELIEQIEYALGRPKR
jgi:antitoxin component YwqK of YwqJK toxin-antitoxin module